MSLDPSQTDLKLLVRASQEWAMGYYVTYLFVCLM